MHDTALLPRGPAPASLRRLQLSTGDIDAYYSSIDRLDVIELCSTWQVIPRIPWLDLSSSRFTDADFALVCHGAVELNIDDFASDNRAVCIVGHLSGGREYTLHMYSHSESQAVDVARYLLAYQKQGLLHALRRLTLSSHVFHLFAQKAGTLAILTELTIVFYPVKTLTDPNDAAQTYSFSWTHLSGLPPAPVLETLRVDIRNRADRIFHTKTHFPTAADALALAPIVRAALNPFERHVRVVVEGFTKEVFSTVDLASWGDVPVTFPFTAQEQGSPSLR
ncbi:hypothetical protein AURDEDRAFT_116486 [Auricularia subglabra TFB-10046 SS5]|nr:hypothetical protein AURDEDRAFT_116486 [Auricularia subglabra TFB-10046 SS5]